MEGAPAEKTTAAQSEATPGEPSDVVSRCTAAVSSVLSEQLTVIASSLTDALAEMGRRLDAVEQRQAPRPMAPVPETNELARSASTSHQGATCNLPTFDGSSALDAYLAQFALVARAGNWDEATKVTALATHLRGPASEVVLTAADKVEYLTFQALVNALDQRFGDKHLRHLHYAQLRHRVQQQGESLPTLAADVDRLTRKVFPGLPSASLDMMAVASFTDALCDPEAQHLLRLAQPRTLREALARALEIDAARRATIEVVSRRGPPNEAFANAEPHSPAPDWPRRRRASLQVQCYRCGEHGHYARNCTGAASGNEQRGQPRGRARR